MNGLKVVFLMTLLMVIFMAIGYMLGGQQGMIIAFALAAVMNFVSYWFSDKMVLKMYRAREVTERDIPKLYRAVKRVVQADPDGQKPMPRVYPVPSKAPNAFATGRNRDHAAIAATEGILEILTDAELEGVMAHELSHIKNHDMLIGTIAATFAGAIGILASMARWGAIMGGYGRDGERQGGLALLVTALVAPLMAMVIQMAISRQREYRADREGGRISGRYLELASALQKLHQSPNRLQLDARPATANLMIANPLSGKGLASLFSTHPPVEERVKRLKQLAEKAPYSYAG
ncbi:MAG: zinc metalloprotease HtpX [bacterium]